MPTRKVQIEITAATEAEAQRKGKAAGVVASKLTTKQIEKLADIVANDPETLSLATTFLGV